MAEKFDLEIPDLDADGTDPRSRLPSLETPSDATRIFCEKDLQQQEALSHGVLEEIPEVPDDLFIDHPFSLTPIKFTQSKDDLLVIPIGGHTGRHILSSSLTPGEKIQIWPIGNSISCVAKLFRFTKANEPARYFISFPEEKISEINFYSLLSLATKMEPLHMQTLPKPLPKPNPPESIWDKINKKISRSPQEVFSLGDVTPPTIHPTIDPTTFMPCGCLGILPFGEKRVLKPRRIVHAYYTPQNGLNGASVIEVGGRFQWDPNGKPSSRISSISLNTLPFLSKQVYVVCLEDGIRYYFIQQSVVNEQGRPLLR